MKKHEALSDKGMVEIVRCGECRYKEPVNSRAINICLCRKVGRIVNDDNFCCWGKEREDENAEVHNAG